MNIQHKFHGRRAAARKGFSLIVSLVLMSFMLLLLVSMTTLVQVEMSATSTIRSQTDAKQAAILGLKVAIGELQESMGPDQRVSATADILGSETNPSQRYLTGVWNSGEDSARVDGENFQQGSLIKWLVSGADLDEDYHQSALAGNVNKAIVVGEGSVADANNNGLNDDQVEVALVPANSENSQYFGWWVGDEGVKARINLSGPLQDTDPAAANYIDPNSEEHKQYSILKTTSSAISNVQTLSGFEAIDMQTNGLADSVINLDDLLFDDTEPESDDIKSRFHDLTTHSFSVLSNTKDGGLKEDLSLAFELSDSAFNSSVFGSNGPNTINSTGFGDVQPIFRRIDKNGINEKTGIVANGPTWHLLRDYYGIYKRIESPMADPVFSAQAFRPNNEELGDVTDWYDLAALRYITDGNSIPRDVLTMDAQGDPLRTDGGEISIPIAANYLPYVQRNLVTIGLQFFDTGPPVPNDYPDTYSFHGIRMLLNPAFVVHNPFNVKIKHDGLATVVDHVRFQMRVESPLDSGYKDVLYSPGNQHMFKTEPGVLEPGEQKIYEGVHPNNYIGYSNEGPADEYWAPSQSTLFEDPNRKPGDPSHRNFKIPVDPAATGPNLTVFYEPFANDRWAYWVYHAISIPGIDSPVSKFHKSDHVRKGGAKFSNYGGHHSDNIYVNYANWYGGEDDEGRDIRTNNFHDSDTKALPFAYLNYDCLLKPSEYDLDTNPFPYPAISHTNPLAPIMQSRNLFPTSKSKPDYGWPVYSPNWQLNVYTTELTTGIEVLQHKGTSAFWGNRNQFGGQTEVSMLELPTSPLLSIGDLQHANISLYGHMPALAIGNSFASPYIERDETYEFYKNRKGSDRIFYDISYLTNEALWDRYFFSSYSKPYNSSSDAYIGTVADSFDIAFDPDKYIGNSPFTTLPNPRMQLVAHDEELIEDIKSKLFDKDSGEPLQGAHTRSAENLMVSGGFNVNSTSVDAWKAILTSNRNLSIYRSGETGAENYRNDTTPLMRFNQPVQSAFNGGSYDNENAWGGFANLRDSEIEDLAEAIVEEIKLRVEDQGHPYISLSSFVNRHLEKNDFGLSGLLQAAIDKSGINGSFEGGNIEINSDSLRGDAGDFPSGPHQNINGADGKDRSTATAASANILAGDLLKVIGSAATVRSDTFRIRAYGESRNPITQEVIGSSLCEAIVQRIPDPVNPSDDDLNDPGYWEPEANDTLGRKFRIVSFRWLDADDA